MKSNLLQSKVQSNPKVVLEMYFWNEVLEHGYRLHRYTMVQHGTMVDEVANKGRLKSVPCNWD